MILRFDAKTRVACGVALLALGLWPPARARAASRVAEATEAVDDTWAQAARMRRRATAHRTLAERIPSVSRRAFSKAGRTELGVDVGLSLNDPFFRTLSPGLDIRHHIDEAFSVGIFAHYDAALYTHLQLLELAGAPARPRLNHLVMDAGILGVWSPLYGKISWLAESVTHFDTYLAAGAGFLLFADGSGPAAHVSVGQHYFLGSSWAVTIEVREQLFTMARAPAVVSARKLQSVLQVLLGVRFFANNPRAPSQP